MGPVKLISRLIANITFAQQTAQLSAHVPAIYMPKHKAGPPHLLVLPR